MDHTTTARESRPVRRRRAAVSVALAGVVAAVIAGVGPASPALADGPPNPPPPTQGPCQRNC